MITVKKEGILLSKTERPFENEGVLNPAVIRVGNRILVFYRAVERGNQPKPRSRINRKLFDGAFNNGKDCVINVLNTVRMDLEQLALSKHQLEIFLL